MDSITKMRTFGQEPEWMAEQKTSGGVTGGRPLATVTYRNVIRVVEEAEARLKKIDVDSDLSFTGAQKAKSRAVLDAKVELARLDHRPKFKAELREALDSAKRLVPNDVVSASIWPSLPTDPLQLEQLYRRAIARSDWHTANSIETLPVAFEEYTMPAEMLERLKIERAAAEDPEEHARAEVANETLDVVDHVLGAAERALEDFAKDLPAPDPETGSTIDDLGFVILTPSQAAEATAGTN